MKIQLSDHFTYKKRMHFLFPTIVMMVFTSNYGVVGNRKRLSTLLAQMLTKEKRHL